MTRVQTDIPGFEPDLPHIRDAIYAWQDAQEDAAREGKRLRDAAKAAEQKALDLVAEAGLKSYPFIDRKTNKRRRFFGASETKAKTQAAPTTPDKPAKRNDAPVKERDPKPSKAERDAQAVEVRTVKRTAEHDAAADPFGAALGAARNGLLERAQAAQAEASEDGEA